MRCILTYFIFIIHSFSAAAALQQQAFALQQQVHAQQQQFHPSQQSFQAMQQMNRVNGMGTEMVSYICMSGVTHDGDGWIDGSMDG